MAINLLKLGEAIFGEDDKVDENLGRYENKVLKEAIINKNKGTSGIPEVDLISGILDLFR